MQNETSQSGSKPTRHLVPGEVLIAQGDNGGDLFVLESGELVVERDGVKIATIAAAGSLVGEMSVLLSRPSSATVKAGRASSVHVIAGARDAIEHDPRLALSLARLMATRLDATSGLLVELSVQNNGKSEQGLLSRILSTLHLPADNAQYVALTRQDLFGGGNDAPRE